MRKDARQLINNKRKWKRPSINNNTDVFKSHISRSIDARKILNLKRKNKNDAPAPAGSFMRNKTATSLIAQQIKSELDSALKVPNKRIQLSGNGNIIVTSKSRNVSQGTSRQFQSSTSRGIDDLEYTSVEDLIDVDSLPHSYVPPKSIQNVNSSRGVIGSVPHVLHDRRYTMVADEMEDLDDSRDDVLNNKVHITLHPSVSRQDIMELFSDIGMVKSIEMMVPGKASVTFFNPADAAKACEVYHNRYLDGQPITCCLDSQNLPQHRVKPIIANRLGKPIYSAFSSHATRVSSPVTFNSRARYNPRSVQFTVKL